MGGLPSSWADPLALCRGIDDSEGRQEDAAALRATEDDIMQDVILRSIQERARGAGEDTELQEALHQSCLEASGKAGAPPEPEDPESATQLMELLAALGLERLDVGSTNLSEGGTVLSNQCFYLAIARSWLADAAHGGGLLVRDSALQLKREIEARVLHVRGSSAERDLGEEREAYADYLACAMRGEGPEDAGGGGTAADLAIAVFASCSGGLEAYEGSGYAQLPREQQVANLSLIWHRPGHFEAVVAAGSGGKADLTLEELLKKAEQQDIPTAAVKA